MIHIVLIAGLSLSSVAAAAPSRSANPPAAVASTASTRASSASQVADLRGSRANPLVIETIERASESEAKNLESTREWWIVGLTAGMLLVAGIQAMLFLRQLRLMNENAKDARMAAEAAKVSADAVELVQRAWLAPWKYECTPFKSKLEVLPDESVVEHAKDRTGHVLQVAWINTGQSPAAKVNGFVMSSGLKDMNSPIPDFKWPKLEEGAAIFLPGQSAMAGHPLSLLDSDLKEIDQRRKRLFLAGGVEYEDVFAKGKKRRSRVCVEVGVHGYTKGHPNFTFTPRGPFNAID